MFPFNPIHRILAVVCLLLLLFCIPVGCSKKDADGENGAGKGSPEPEWDVLHEFETPPAVEISELEQRVKSNPEDPESHYLLAEHLFSREQSSKERGADLSEAIESHYREAIRLNPLDPRPYMGLGLFLNVHSTKRKERAAEMFQKVVELDPENAPAYMALGGCYRFLSRYEDSEKALKRAVELYRQKGEKGGLDGNEEFFYRQAKEFLGRVYTEQNKYDLAEAILHESVDGLDAYNSKYGAYWGCPYQALGALYASTGRRSEAATQYARAADAESGNFGPQMDAALQCYLTADYENAAKYIERALALDKQASVMVIKGFLLLLQQKYEEAKTQFQLAAELEPGETGAFVGMGHALLLKKDYGGARPLLEGGMATDKEDPPSPGIHPNTFYAYRNMIANMACLGMGWWFANQNRHKEAISFYDQILSREPQDMLALLGKGNSLSGLGRLDEAEVFFQKVLKLQPENRYALAELALVKYNRGDDPGAEQAFQAALAVDDQPYTCPYEGLGLIYLRQGKWEQAKKYFNKSIEINPNIEYKKYNGLARILLKEGNVDRARELLQKSIENYPYDGEAKELLEQIERKRPKPDSSDRQPSPADQPG